MTDCGYFNLLAYAYYLNVACTLSYFNQLPTASIYALLRQVWFSTYQDVGTTMQGSAVKSRTDATRIHIPPIRALEHSCTHRILYTDTNLRHTVVEGKM